MAHPRSQLLCVAMLLSGVLAVAGGGCGPTPVQVPPAERVTLDRRYVEYPADTEFTEGVRGLTGRHPRLFAVKPDGTQFAVYPVGRRFPVSLFNKGFQIYGPVGGIAVSGDGTVYCSHRDENGLGVITAFKYDGTHRDVVGGLPARGDHGMGDVAIGPGGRLWFACGSATNSGVVGGDNWDVGWVKQYPLFSDRPF